MEISALESNVRSFIWFRVFFNARFYYPVFAILFLDYGLTLEQFTILNIVWAVTIVFAEVPSGALADVVGRRNLIVFSAIMMVIEMGLLAVVPLGASSLLFIVFFINRVCSGLAEAAASGADEAIAYDSLKILGREKEWSRVLERTSRYHSIAIFSAMILGAISYDANMLNRIFQWIGFESHIEKSLTLRLPIYLTLGTALIVLFAALRMKEPPSEVESKGPTHPIRQSFLQIFNVAKWTLGHRFILFVILGGIILDSVARQLILLSSEYYRSIEIDPAYIGFVAAAMSLLGVLYARLARFLAEKKTPLFNLIFLSIVLITGLIGTQFLIPYYGVLFAAMVFSMLGIVAYLQSYYINQHVESRIRATVISFKGLALNLGLGVASLFYAILISRLRENASSLDEDALGDYVFRESLSWFPGYYVVLFVLLFISGTVFIRKKHLLFKKGLEV